MGELLNFFNDLFGGFIKPNGKSGAVLKTTFVQYIHISRFFRPTMEKVNFILLFKRRKGNENIRIQPKNMQKL